MIKRLVKDDFGVNRSGCVLGTNKHITDVMKDYFNCLANSVSNTVKKAFYSKNVSQGQVWKWLPIVQEAHSIINSAPNYITGSYPNLGKGVKQIHGGYMAQARMFVPL